MRQTFIVVLLIVVILGGLLLVMRLRAPNSPPPTTEQIWKEAGIPVETSFIRRGDIEQVVEVTGDINALENVTLSAKIAGRVAQVYAREGDFVTKGATVVELDQEDALSSLQEARGALQAATARLSQAKTSAAVTKIQTDAAIEQAQAAVTAAEANLATVKKPARTQERMVAENKLASAKANLDNAEADYKRHKKLLEEGAISQATFDVVEAQYKVKKADYNTAEEQLSLIKEGGRAEDINAAQAQLDVSKQQLRLAKADASQILLRQEDVKSAQAALQQAKAAVALAEQRLSYTRIKSPISGYLASRTTEPGQVVAAGQPLAQVVDLDSLYLKGDVSETALPAVNMGQRVRVRVDAIPGRVFEGTVGKIFPTGSLQSRNFPVRIDIADPGRSIRPGMFARGEIISGVDKDVMLVPKDAVLERRGSKSVFTVGDGGTVTRHDVEVVRENLHYVEVETPTSLQVGDQVVTSGKQNLQKGSKVSVRSKGNTASRSAASDI